MMNVESIKNYVNDHAPFNWQQFYALPYELYDGAISFWEAGYDYSDPDFWDSYPEDVQSNTEAIHAVQMFDWLMQHDPDGYTGKRW